MNCELFVNYNHAQNLLSHNDMFVVRLLTTIHRSMLRIANSNLRPESPFDMRYFYGALVRSVAGKHGHSVGIGRVSSPLIRSVNVPNFDESMWATMHFVRTGIASSFVQLVQAESRLEGAPFDMNFACRIAGESLDAEAIQFACNGIGSEQSNDDDFDTWLAGFSTTEDL